MTPAELLWLFILPCYMFSILFFTVNRGINDCELWLSKLSINNDVDWK